MFLSTLDREANFQSQALKLRSYRQQLLASNIANADTPNYKAVDINFEKELQRITSRRSDAISLQTTQQNHLQARSANSLGAQVQYRTEIQPNIDGNTVNLDVERAKMAENAFRYENTVRTLNGQFRGLLSAIRG